MYIIINIIFINFNIFNKFIKFNTKLFLLQNNNNYEYYILEKKIINSNLQKKYTITHY